MALLVIDTNVTLDLLVFDDPAAQALHAGLIAGRWQWLATPAMRDELARVLGYPRIARWLARGQRSAVQVLAAFDAQVQLQPVPAGAPVICQDPDDQKFIDLALAHQALLLSKDQALLCLRKRLLAHGVRVQSALSAGLDASVLSQVAA